MKVICKIFKHYPETNQINVAIGRLNSQLPIDKHRIMAVSYDQLDMTDIESFKFSLIQKIHSSIEESEKKLPVLDENKPVEIDELDIDKLVGKVFSGEIVDKSIRLLKMRRVHL
tara:strand:+ start:75 stop:416 length:342 start_codon:yes stop_codon:yes gene_type:complete